MEEKGELYMYICQNVCIHLSNNYIYVTYIHMHLYIWRARLGEEGERRVRSREGGERAESRERRILYVNLIDYVYLSKYYIYVIAIHM